MNGPEIAVRSHQINGYRNNGPLFEWREKAAYLIIDEVEFKGVRGAVLCYYNPPVHQVGNPGLDAYLEGLRGVLAKADSLSFVLLHGPCDPVHAGGDLKESLSRLDSTLQRKRQLVASGAAASEIEKLFDWADNRLKKGLALYRLMRDIASRLRLAATCGGGTRFGGSAEIPLMADFLVGDSRSAMCFSEAMIGLIPGWAGVGRAISKAGAANAEGMAKTAREVKAQDLLEIGIYNKVVEISLPFPKKVKGADSEKERADFEKAMVSHELTAGTAMLKEGLEICISKDIPRSQPGKVLVEGKKLDSEVARRMNPSNYEGYFGRPLAEVREEMVRLGRPLAPQSIEALNRLFSSYDPSAFYEDGFVEREMLEDAALYRDPRFRAGLVATLEQKVADFREAIER
jgi:enoyl-CoA hydratase/carnithine racemase